MVIVLWVVCALALIGGVLSVAFGAHWLLEKRELRNSPRGWRFWIAGLIITLSSIRAGLNPPAAQTLPGLLALTGVIVLLLGCLEADEQKVSPPRWAIEMIRGGLVATLVFGVWWAMTATPGRITW